MDYAIVIGIAGLFLSAAQLISSNRQRTLHSRFVTYVLALDESFAARCRRGSLVLFAIALSLLCYCVASVFLFPEANLFGINHFTLSLLMLLLFMSSVINTVLNQIIAFKPLRRLDEAIRKHAYSSVIEAFFAGEAILFVAVFLSCRLLSAINVDIANSAFVVLFLVLLCPMYIILSFFHTYVALRTQYQVTEARIKLRGTADVYSDVRNYQIKHGSLSFTIDDEDTVKKIITTESNLEAIEQSVNLDIDLRHIILSRQAAQR